MPVSLALLLTAGVLIACGVYLFLERTLTRVLLGFILAGNGVNLLFLVAAGPPGRAPFQGDGDESTMSDPLPFAMVLTAIVITLGVSAFVSALAYRAWQLFGHDEVPDDLEDRRVLRRSRSRRVSRRHAVRAGADLASAEGVADAPDESAPPEEGGHAPGAGTLSERHRHGALAEAQGRGAEAEDLDTDEAAGAEEPDEGGDDPLGGDLSSATDAPMDTTECDEDEEER
ncbi:Na(+)/H(+) antiporter subunit C [Brachybacterium huguangmaarense]|uniref:Na(+)/H(+) antiporter subunit C n=1 Tax=Brachybacterium huguangmaarense TaxID=1652028 RepID=UPI002964D562|nr:Na(+)/H(+) antiporter subunit C [Brachybacterium huguangmaarense]